MLKDLFARDSRTAPLFTRCLRAASPNLLLRVLHADWTRVTGLLGERPAVLARQIFEQPQHERPCPTARFHSGEPARHVGHQALAQRLQPGGIQSRIPPGDRNSEAVPKNTDDEDELLAFFDFPAEHWIHPQTTNPIWVLYSCHRLGSCSPGRRSKRPTLTPNPIDDRAIALDSKCWAGRRRAPGRLA